MKFVQSLLLCVFLANSITYSFTEPDCLGNFFGTIPTGIRNFNDNGKPIPIIVSGIISEISQDTTKLLFEFSDRPFRYNIFTHICTMPSCLANKWDNSFAKSIKLNQFSANEDTSFSDSILSSMLSNVDSSAIYIPFDLPVQKGDHIYISQYSAYYDGRDCSSAGAAYTGTYQIFRDGVEIDQFAKDTSSVSVLPHPKKRATPKTKNSLKYDLQGRIRTQGKQQILLFKR